MSKEAQSQEFHFIYIPDEIVKKVFEDVLIKFASEDIPVSQELIDDTFTSLNGDLDLLKDKDVDLICGMMDSTNLELTAIGVFTLVGKGALVELNELEIRLPKIWVCEEI